MFDAVITDPPYASGGSRPHEKNRTTNQKYSSMEKENALHIVSEYVETELTGSRPVSSQKRSELER